MIRVGKVWRRALGGRYGLKENGLESGYVLTSFKVYGYKEINVK